MSNKDPHEILLLWHWHVQYIWQLDSTICELLQDDLWFMAGFLLFLLLGSAFSFCITLTLIVLHFQDILGICQLMLLNLFYCWKGLSVIESIIKVMPVLINILATLIEISHTWRSMALHGSPSMWPSPEPMHHISPTYLQQIDDNTDIPVLWQFCADIKMTQKHW